MNLVKELLSEQSKSRKDKIVDYIGSNPKRFGQLIKLFLAGPYRVTQRASWPLSYCVQQYPQLITPYLKKLLAVISSDNPPEAAKRNIYRTLQFTSIPKSLQGRTYELAIATVTTPSEAIAVRVFALTVAGNIAKENPDLRNEIRLIIEDQLPFGSAGFVSRSKKILKALKH